MAALTRLCGGGSRPGQGQSIRPDDCVQMRPSPDENPEVPELRGPIPGASPHSHSLRWDHALFPDNPSPPRADPDLTLIQLHIWLGLILLEPAAELPPMLKKVHIQQSKEEFRGLGL